MVFSRCSSERKRWVADLADAAVAALDPAGLGVGGLDEAMRDAVLGADSIEGVFAGGFTLPGRAETIRKRLAIVGKDPTDYKKSFSDQGFRKSLADCADLSARISTYTQWIARSMAANRYWQCGSSGIWDRNFRSSWTTTWRVVLSALGGLLGGVLASVPLPPVARDSSTSQAKERG